MTEQPDERPAPFSRRRLLTAGAAATAAALPLTPAAPGAAAAAVGRDRWTPSYPDGRPTATLRLEAQDEGPVLRHGGSPDAGDGLGARDVWVYRAGGTLYMNYDAAGDRGWLAALATSKDGRSWTKHGPVLDLGAPGADDSGSAGYGVTYRNGPGDWHMFYLGTPHTSPPPDRVPAFPYLTLKARGSGPAGPWTKTPDVIPFRPKADTYYSVTASPGHVVRHRGEFLQFFSASALDSTGATLRTIGLARTGDLGGPWQIDDRPVVPLTEQIENSSLYYEPAHDTWFLFTNHVGLDEHGEYTDAIWVYWTRDLLHWDPADKAVVLDRNNCAWSPFVIGLPSVLPSKGKLAVFYDGRAAQDTSHMGRDVALAWLDLPLRPPTSPA
ncbi:hypothetical protein [Streptomyces sp. NPDC057302]|uniref:hypothetical protein n=1 Tax=Streptomyces sp. NPDC057302 TaxID=3346094 RepID=UPI00362CD8A2